MLPAGPDSKSNPSNAFLNQGAFSRSRSVLICSFSFWVVNIPISASQVHDLHSASFVWQQVALNMFHRKVLSKPWSLRMLPTYAGKFLVIIIIIRFASGELGTTACTGPITPLAWWISTISWWPSLRRRYRSSRVWRETTLMTFPVLSSLIAAVLLRYIKYQ